MAWTEPSGFCRSTVEYSRFVIQGGGFTPKLERKETYRPIKNESDNGLSNVRGSIAMARVSEPDTATNQFYINLVDNSSALDPRPSRPGYAVFGKVIDGMKVVDEIGNLPTVKRGQFRSAPNPLVVIKKVQILQLSPENIKKYQPHLSPKDILNHRHCLLKYAFLITNIKIN
ncbi:MAG: peptidylprolyl isomerase [Candidatus Oxydemutatoraceae bacterium WSBS_2016_MAG_OTU14]